METPENEENIKNKVPIPCKVIVVGDSGVGKTSIVGRYMNKYNQSEKATIGASYSSRVVNIDGYKISFDIWDTAGQERFRSVNTIFYKEAYICILVYDITKKDSFTNIKKYWYDTVKENSLPGIIFGLAGNKLDLFEKEEVNKNEAEEFSAEINATFKLTSALENTSIDDFFTMLGQKYIESSFFKDLYERLASENKQRKKLKKPEAGKDERGGKCC